MYLLTIRSTMAENPMLRANLMSVS